MQYLISVGFHKDPWKRADQLHCSEVALLKAGHVVKKVLKPVLWKKLIAFVLLIYFTVINPIRYRMAIQKKQKRLLTLALWFFEWQNRKQ